MRVSPLLLAGALLSASLPTLAATSLDFTTEYPAKSIQAQNDAFFVSQVTQLTQGNIDITLHPGGALGFTSADNFYAVADGSVQIADSLAGTFGGNDPIFLLSSLPFVVSDADEAEALYKRSRSAYEKVLEQNNQMLLYVSPWPASGIWSREPVNTPTDLSQLKIRSYDRNGTQVLRNAGAAPLMLSWADVVPQLTTGGIDAVLTSAEAGANVSFWDQLNNFTAIRYAIPLNIVTMNRDTFNDLSEAGQKAILEAAKRTDQHNWQVVRTRTAENFKLLASHDVAINQAPSKALMSDLRKAAQPVVDDWLKTTGATGKALLKPGE